MNKVNFNHLDLKLIDPPFKSPLTNLVIELDFLRKKKLEGSTEPIIFFQLKKIFHSLESLGSARIEGNNTTISEYIETKLEQIPPSKAQISQKIKEILNIEKALTFIEREVETSTIDRKFISEIHKIVVEGLSPPPQGDGDRNPGYYRKQNVKIAKSNHCPPDWLKVGDYMNELLEFINVQNESKYDLLKTAIAHHRFVWIHPFVNGNGRVVRLLTYTMLIKQGFNIKVDRLINPTAIFCNNRDDYYFYLSQADEGSERGILDWCEYMLKGLKTEIDKIDRLLDYSFLSKSILLPAIDYSLEQKLFSVTDAKVLKRAVEKQIIQNSDLKDIFNNKTNSEISRQIKKLLEKKLLIPIKENARKYVLSFSHSYLLRSVIKLLIEEGFISIKD